MVGGVGKNMHGMEFVTHKGNNKKWNEVGKKLERSQ